MDIQLEPGRYVIAVSGGVDSIALLHILQSRPDLRLVVAHFDHGIREDSATDRLFVQSLAQHYRLPFVYEEGHLGAKASEATAREARYKFLYKARQASGAEAIITAHHQDDMLETAILNLLRGSGRKGLTALADRHDIRRPLLHVPKQDIIAYARDQGLRWREDSTNADERYLRNYIRRQLLPRFAEQDRAHLHEIIKKLHATNQEIDTLLVNYMHFQSRTGKLDRQWFNHLPHAVAREVLAGWLRAQAVRSFDSKLLERLVVAAKVAQPGKLFPLLHGRHLEVGQRYLALTPTER